MKNNNVKLGNICVNADWPLFFSLTERKFKKKRNKFRKFVYYLSRCGQRRTGPHSDRRFYKR